MWAVGEIDHTPLDLSLVSSVTGAALGTAYLSVLIDAHTRMPLAFVLRLGAPRRYPVLELLHECVRRHGRVPDNIVVDGGAEFSSNDVEMAFAVLEISKIERATGRPKQGAVIERMFGISTQLMTHQLRGNTEPNNPARSTVFRVANLYGFDKYDPALLDVWRDAVHEHGLDPPR